MEEERRSIARELHDEVGQVLTAIKVELAVAQRAIEAEGGDRGLGLIGIRERATHLQGTLRLETAPGKGTRLTVELPARSRPSVDDAGAVEASQPMVEPVV